MLLANMLGDIKVKTAEVGLLLAAGCGIFRWYGWNLALASRMYWTWGVPVPISQKKGG